MSWQPIETAPKDGTIILVADDVHGSVGLAEWDMGRWYIPETDSNLWVSPTHWQPLPAAPISADRPQPAPALSAGDSTEGA
jgi:hypothetical protein